MGDADRLRSHDLVREAVLHHAVLVDPRLVREGVATDERLVGLREDARHVRQQPAGAIQLARLDVTAERGVLRPDVARHHDLLARGVAGALADTVHRALHLPRPGRDGGEGVGDGEAAMVVTVGRERYPCGSRDALPHGAEDLLVLGREREAHRVRQIDRRGALLDRRCDHAAQVLEVGAARVFRRELDVVGVAAGPAHGGARQLETVVPADLELVLQVNVGGRDEDVDASPGGRAQRLAREIDVLVGAARQRRQHRTAYLSGDFLDAAVVAGRGRREARLDHVDVQGIELTRHLYLFLGRHGVARRLLPVAQRGVENDDVSDHELSPLAVRKQNAADLGDPRRLLACPTGFSLASRYWPARRDPRVVQSGPGAGPAAGPEADAEARRPTAWTGRYATCGALSSRLRGRLTTHSGRQAASRLKQVPFVPGDVELPPTPRALQPPGTAAQRGPLTAGRAHRVVGAPLRRELTGPFGPGHHAPASGGLGDDLDEVVGDDQRLTVDVEDGFQGADTRHAVPSSPAQRTVDVDDEASPLHSGHGRQLSPGPLGRDVTHRTGQAATRHPAWTIRGQGSGIRGQGSVWWPTIMSVIMSLVPDRIVAARSCWYRVSVVSTSGHTAPRSGTNRPATAPMPPSRIACPVGLSYTAVRR